jgi:hypothetical protein
MGYPFPFPLINGNRLSYASVEVNVAGTPYRGVKSVTYKNAVERQKVFGTSSRALGRTRGKYDPDASIEVFKEEAVAIRAQLAALGAGGYGETTFDIAVSYAEGGLTVTDKLYGCLINDDEDSHSQGADGLTEKWTLSVIEIEKNGVSMLSPLTYSK